MKTSAPAALAADRTFAVPVTLTASILRYSDLARSEGLMAAAVWKTVNGSDETDLGQGCVNASPTDDWDAMSVLMKATLLAGPVSMSSRFGALKSTLRMLSGGSPRASNFKTM